MREEQVKFLELDLSDKIEVKKDRRSKQTQKIKSKEDTEEIETQILRIDENDVFKLMQTAEGSQSDWVDKKPEEGKPVEGKTKVEAVKAKQETKVEVKSVTPIKTVETAKPDKTVLRSVTPVNDIAVAAKAVKANVVINKVQEVIQKEQDAYKQSADMNFPYIASRLVTNAELTLYHFMQTNLCQINNIAILPKVRLGDLIELDTKLTTDKSYYWKVACKHVDFVICRKDNLKVICVVELDDYTHETKEAQAKDMFIMQALKTAGIDTVRIKTRIALIGKQDLELIDEYINKEFAPNCPVCGLPMVPKKCMRGVNRGHRFFACSNNISCRHTINID